MPEVSRFLGIIIAQFFNDHSPPHFHVRYGDQKAILSIEELRLIAGRLPPRVLGLVVEWATLHQKELMENWDLVSSQQLPNKIMPLE